MNDLRLSTGSAATNDVLSTFGEGNPEIVRIMPLSIRYQPYLMLLCICISISSKHIYACPFIALAADMGTGFLPISLLCN